MDMNSSQSNSNFFNEAADKAAKQALDLPVTEMGIHYEDYKLQRIIYTDYGREDDECIGNKLNKVKPVLGDRKLPGHLSRQEEIVLSRLHIGHTRLAHSHRMNGADMPGYVTCNVSDKCILGSSALL